MRMKSGGEVEEKVEERRDTLREKKVEEEK